jgi:hypothetical protein
LPVAFIPKQELFLRLFVAILGLIFLGAIACSESNHATTPQKGDGVQKRMDRNELPRPHDKKVP